jgi:hypothetical protein
MTPRYVAQSYKLPPNVLSPALFLVKGKTRVGYLLEQSLRKTG